MTSEKIKEIITGERYSLNFETENLLQLRKLDTGLYDFYTFKIDETVTGEIRNYAGNKLCEFCKINSIVISTDNRNYDMPTTNFLEEFGFKIKYEKIIYEKNLDKHYFEYTDFFEYKSLQELGLNKFMKVFEQITDFYAEREGSEMEFFNELFSFTGDNYDPSCYLVPIYNAKEIGVIIPHVFPKKDKKGTLIYIGVVPEERNKGYGKIMHSKGLEILKNKGVKRYIGSTMTTNKSMLRIFEANGCTVRLKRKFYYTG